MFDPVRCRSCQFHSCLTWLHKNDSNAKKRKKKKELNHGIKYDTISFVFIRRMYLLYSNYKKCHSHVIFSEIKTWDYFVDFKHLKNGRSKELNVTTLMTNCSDIQKNACVLSVWCVDLSHTNTHFYFFSLKLIWWMFQKRNEKNPSTFRKKLLVDKRYAVAPANGLELHSVKCYSIDVSVCPNWFYEWLLLPRNTFNSNLMRNIKKHTFPYT